MECRIAAVSDYCMDDLFSASKAQAPLADRMRPQVLDEIVGQDHIVGKGRLLRRSIQADRLSSLILYGPPGTGKTSLARVIANSTKACFESLNAVLAGIKDIREAIDRANEKIRLYGKRTILFVDEVHRWNKAQQDALLPWVENGTVILVGATTENPFFEVNRALVSRSRVFQLKALMEDDLLKTALNAINNKERGYGLWNIVFEKGALEHLVEVSSGDARSLLNALELAVETTPPSWPPPAGTSIRISMEAAEESIQKRAVLYDRDGDYHFDTISAFIKSVRGSDPDAALYWLAKMVRSGEDPSFIFRRMIILASEDVGLADPYALQVVVSCAESFDRIGFPEGNFPLAHACLYLATAPKSNSAMAFFDALGEVDKEDAEVPNHLRDASRDKESFGHGVGYVYPHAYREHWTSQQYLPAKLQGKIFYTPSESGYEKTIRDSVIQKREIQAASLLEENNAVEVPDEFLSWSPQDKGRDGWLKRLQSNRSASLLLDRDRITKLGAIKRHDRVLVLQAGSGLLVWETLRLCPEGLCAATVESPEERDTLLRLASNVCIDEINLPKIAVCRGGGLPDLQTAQNLFGCDIFDCIEAREPLRRLLKDTAEPPLELIRSFALCARNLLADDGSIVLLCSPPEAGQRMSFILKEECAVSSLLYEKLAAAEEDFFSPHQKNVQADSKAKNRLWNENTLREAFNTQDWDCDIITIDQKEERFITEHDIQRWFDAHNSVWGSFIHARLGDDDFFMVKKLLAQRAAAGTIIWNWKSLLVKAKKIR